MLFEVTEVDQQVYDQEIRDFLPDKLIDIHTHVWVDRLKAHSNEAFSRVVQWPSLVAKENPVEDLIETYKLMFPDKQVTPLMFSSIKPDDDFDGLNDYIRDSAQKYHIPALLYAKPEWSGAELEKRVIAGGFLGVKVYLNLAPAYIPAAEIRIFDFLPPHQLEVLHQHRWIVMLHIPRNGRLRDAVNLAQMREIDHNYPGAQVIIAHVGRAYCPEDVGNAFEVLADAEHLRFDFSANTNDWVFEQLIKAVGPKRILFGSDLPILRMRMRRICEQGTYINLVPQGLYGNVSGDKNMREVAGDEATRLTFFMYEEILAFKRAAERTGMTSSDINDIFYNNGKSLIESVL
ncbi:aminotransferase class-III [Candidatus Vecturithrix granuli]|uniref:Aminotransferase class-III n=1 Tax=Vecturithrix granuli TaxID=1499967 RepID=A0A081C475_VECG1|nr:aminotransferase class-III [Candidatus Vecturithrix granuli]